MTIRPLSKRLSRYVVKYGITLAFAKQCALFEMSPLHPSLNTEVLEPKHLRIYSFRITRKYRAIFIYRGNNTIEILDVTNHYQ